MKYIILFTLLILSLFYAGTHLYMIYKNDKSVKHANIDSLPRKNRKIPYYLTDRFWKNASLKQLKSVLKNIENINERRRDGHTMLHLLVIRGKYPEMVGTLISSGLDYRIRSRRKIARGGKGYIKLKPLYYALLRQKQAFEFTKELLRYDTGMNEVGFIGEKVVTPLTFAAFNRSPIEIIKLLLEKGADPNFPGATSTPLINASLPNSKKNIDLNVIQLLLDYKADITQKHPSGKTACDYMKEDPELVKTELFKKICLEAISKLLSYKLNYPILLKTIIVQAQ